ncbi:MAG: hypothetical protein H6573_23935 [Lewinellaceae bacterium]|nr:hypothetical protein [Lewinellaceae bacterium]
MHHSKLLHLLKVLDAPELKRLSRFLKSPFYNTNPHLVKLYQLLRKEHPQFDSPKLAKEKVFKKLFPGLDYDHQKLLNLMTDFTALLKQYLQALQLEKEEPVQERLLLKAFAERPHSYDIFVKHVQKTGRRLDALPYRNIDFYREKFWLSQLYFNHPGTDKFQLSKAEYDASMQQLDRWFLLEKLLLSCEMKAREKPLSEVYDIWLLSEIREAATRFPAERSIAGAYLEMLNLLEKGEATAYFQLKALLLEHRPQFTRRQQQHMLESLINYAIRQGNKGKEDFLRESLELYQFGLAGRLFLEYEILNDMVYINVVNIALRAGEATWCRQFIDQYAPFLEPRAQKDAQSLATALWLYAEQQPAATIGLLQKVEFLNVYYQIQARVLLLKVYFEAFREDDGYFELILSQAEAFERYLRRNQQVSEAQSEALLNFTLTVKRLAKLKQSNALHRQARAALKPELQALSPLYNRSWLLRQLE